MDEIPRPGAPLDPGDPRLARADPGQAGDGQPAVVSLEARLAGLAESLDLRPVVVIAEGRATTYDLGGPAGTSQFADAIIERLAVGASSAPVPLP